MTLPNWYCLTGSKGPDMLVTQLPFRCWDITWACCASQGYWEGWIGSGWGNTLEMVKGRVQSSWLWVPLSPDVSLTSCPSFPHCHHGSLLLHWVGKGETVGCGRLSQGRQELLCVPDQRQDRGLPAASLSPTMAPSRPQPYIQSHDHQPGHPLELLKSFFLITGTWAPAQNFYLIGLCY